MLHGWKTVVDHFKANVFSFTVAVEPQDEIVDTLGFVMQVLRQSHFGIGFVLADLATEELDGIQIPGIVLGRKVDIVHVSCHRRKLEMRIGLVTKRSCPLMNWCCTFVCLILKSKSIQQVPWP